LVKFWDISGKNEISDVKFSMLFQFELDGICLSLHTNGEQAVVSTHNGTISYLSKEGNNDLGKFW
jgi:hypothetical protein